MVQEQIHVGGRLARIPLLYGHVENKTQKFCYFTFISGENAKTFIVLIMTDPQYLKNCK